jgi:chaperone modulatory protein CbpM
MRTTIEIASGVVIDEQSELSLEEFCHACSMQTDWIVTLVEEGVLEPSGQSQSSWRFTGVQLRNALTIARLQRDLGVNLAGAALALELLDEIETLRRRLAALDEPR